MNSMFSDCSNLISLNLSNFNTSSVTSMSSMFNGWAKLESLDLSYFDTSQVNNMYGMFSGCSNLLSLNLSNFNISGVSSISSMFNGCNRLEYVDLINTKINPNIIPDSTFSNLPSNLYICSENEDWAKIFNLLDKQYVNCINNISYFNINENENKIKCYKNNIESDNPCYMCGNNYFNNIGIINNTYINCYIDDISDYSTFDSSIIINIENKTELIQNVINTSKISFSV